MAKKQDILDRIYAEVDGVEQGTVNQVVDAIFTTLGGLSDDNKFRAAGFGTFKHTLRGERQGFHPKTREPMTTPARNTITFKIAKDFKESLKPAAKKKSATKAKKSTSKKKSSKKK